MLFERSIPTSLRTDVLVQSDLDGSAVDSEYLKRRTYQDTIRHLFGVECTIESLADLLGLDRSETIKKLTERFERMPRTNVLSDEVGIFLGEIILRERLKLDKYVTLTPRPGFTDVLDSLDELRVPRVIVTSAPELQAYNSLAVTNLVGRFDDVVGIGTIAPGGIVASRTKPDPELYDISTARFKAEHRQRFAIEDSLPGVLAAKRSGAKTIYAHDIRVGPVSDEAAYTADFTASSMDEVRQYLADSIQRV